MKISTIELQTDIYSHLDSEKIIILPEMEDKNEAFTYASTAVSLMKKLRQEQLPIDFFAKPETLLEQRGVEWFGPTLLIFSSLYNSNPDIFNLLIEIIKNHVSSLYSPAPSPIVKLNINIHKSKNQSTTNVKYEGSVDGLKELSKKLAEICHEKK